MSNDLNRPSDTRNSLVFVLNVPTSTLDRESRCSLDIERERESRFSAENIEPAEFDDESSFSTADEIEASISNIPSGKDTETIARINALADFPISSGEALSPSLPSQAASIFCAGNHDPWSLLDWDASPSKMNCEDRWGLTPIRRLN